MQNTNELGLKEAFIQYAKERTAPIVSPDYINQLKENGILCTVHVPENVTEAQMEQIFRKDADLCVSCRFFGMMNGVYTKQASIYENKFSLDENPEEFPSFVYGVAMTGNREEVVLENFLMVMEVFDTRNDPNWGSAVLQFNVQSSELDIGGLLDRVKLV